MRKLNAMTKTASESLERNVSLEGRWLASASSKLDARQSDRGFLLDEQFPNNENKKSEINLDFPS